MDSKLIYVEACASTNDEILKYLPSSEVVAVYTFNQYNGRGQYGNKWNTKPDQNIAFSFAIAAESISLQPNLFNFHTAIVFRDFLVKITSFDVFLKWPNDIILSGKKVAGILIEKKRIEGIEYYIVGIGINVLQEEFEGISKAGSIFTQTGLSLDLHKLSGDIFDCFCEHLKSYPTDQEILRRYNNFLFKKGEVSVFNTQNCRQNGIIQHVDKDGYLWVELEQDGLQKFYHKEIELLY